MPTHSPIRIRPMNDSDPQIICAEEAAQGWHPSDEKYRQRLEDHAAGRSVALVAEYEGSVV